MLVKTSRRKFFENILLQTAHAGVFGSALSRSSNSKAQGLVLPHILTIHCHGGWDPTMVFDPKLNITGYAQEANTSILSSPSGISFLHHADRPAVQTFFDTHGTRVAVINGINCRSMSHEQAKLKSSASIDPNTGLMTDWLSVYASRIASHLTIPHLNMDAPYAPGLLGSNCINLSLSNLNTLNQLNFESDKAITSTTSGLIRSLREWSYTSLRDSSTLAGIDGQKSAMPINHLIRSKLLLDTFNGITFSDNDSDFLKRALLALTLFQAGHCQVASIGSLPDDGWDTHRNNYSIQSTNYQSLFSDLDTILTTATNLGILNKLIIVVKSELGRGAQLNSSDGKEHWSFTSGMVVGDIFKGGQTFHSTNNYFVAEQIDPLLGVSLAETNTYLNWEHIFGAIFLMSGVAPDSVWPGIRVAAMILKEIT